MHRNSLERLWSKFLLYNINILHTVFPPIEAGSQIQAGGQTSFVLIEAGSLIQAGSLTEAGEGGLRDEYHSTNCASPRSTAVRCVILAYCVISI